MTRPRRSDLARIFKQGDTLRLQFPREDIGFAYAPPQPATLAAARRQLTAAGRTEAFQPALRVGGRLPHARLRVCDCPRSCPCLEGSKMRRTAACVHGCSEISTVDLPGLWPGRFVHIHIHTTGDVCSSFASTDTLSVACATSVHIATPQGGPFDEAIILRSNLRCEGTAVSDLDCRHFVALDELPGMRLQSGEGVPERRVSAVLVRPDGHVDCIL